MTAIRSNFANELNPAFRAIYFEEFQRLPEEFPGLFNVESSMRQEEKEGTLAGLGTVPEKDEGVGITYDDPIEGYNKTYTHTPYGLGFRVTREMMEDDLSRKMRQMPSALAISMRITRETDGANVINNGHDSSFTGPDGKELFATDHPLKGGGTEQNEPTTDADLSESSFEQALIDIAATTDERGLLISLMPMRLVVAKANAFTAAKLLESTLEPGSPNNAINPAKGVLPGGWSVNHYFTDDDKWVIYCDRHFVTWFNRRNPDFEQGNDFDTEDAKFKATARWSRGWTDWRGVYSSKGA